ncbi:MAG: ATP-binding protein [Acidimicrobiaceae bacterium]|nr:ATP-binding protein [Acidimicrobiaceae bacterium]
MIRREIADLLPKLFRQFPFVSVTGPRQSGKTTLCQSVFDSSEVAYVSLDAMDVRQVAEYDPRGFLRDLGRPAVIDEVQHVPALFSYLKEAADADGANGQYVLTGSENFKLNTAISESLAGRVAQLRLLPFSLEERHRADGVASFAELAYSGFYPRIIDQQLEPRPALADYFDTYIERDVRRMGGVGDLSAFRQFAALCAGRIGQLVNLSSLGGDLGITHTTVRNWLTVLERSYIVFVLEPYHKNIGKRLTKSPKLYFYDVGLASYLLGIQTPSQVTTHPLRGQLFENIVIAESVKYCYNRRRQPRLSFYRESGGLECDLLYETGRGINAVEVKSGATVVSDWLRPLSRVASTVPGVTAQTLVFGGEQGQSWSGADIVTLGEFSSSLERFDTETAVIVSSEGAVLAGADVLALYPNGTRVNATTDARGVARFDFHTDDLPMTVFVAGPGLGAHVSTGWLPADGALSVEMAPLSGGGSAIFEDQTGYLPGIKGRLNPILERDGRSYLYTTNVAVNGVLSSSAVHFAVGDDILRLEDADGGACDARFVAMSGQSSLLEYHSPPQAG